MGNNKKKKGTSSADQGEGEGPTSRDPLDGETQQVACKHLAQKVNANKLKNVLPHALPRCQGCHPDAGTHSKKKHAKGGKSDTADTSMDSGDGTASLEDLWVCLKCGYLGCNKNDARHSIVHRVAEKHTVVMNLHTQEVWCFDCDDSIPAGVAPLVDSCAELVGQFLHRHTSSHGASSLSRNTSVVSSAKGKDRRSSAHDFLSVSPANPEAVPPRDGSALSKKHYISSHNSSRLDLRTPDKARGLVNLGNTCFFNAVLQSIARAAPLRDYLARDQDEGVARQIPLVPEARNHGRNPHALVLPPITVTMSNRDGPTKSLFRNLISELHSSEGKSVNPKAFFSHICKLSPRFAGYQQQDSQELLRTVLDWLDYEEKMKVKVALLEHFGVDDFVRSTAGINDAIKHLEPEKLKQLQIYLRSYKSFVELIFSGRFCSVVTCENCNLPSRAKEDFLDLSIPIQVTPSAPKKKFISFPAKKDELEVPKMTEKERKKQEKLKKKEEEKLRKSLKKAKKTKSCKVDVAPGLLSSSSALSTPLPTSSMSPVPPMPAPTSFAPEPLSKPSAEERSGNESDSGKRGNVEEIAIGSSPAAVDITITEPPPSDLNESTLTVNGAAGTDTATDGEAPYGWGGLVSSSKSSQVASSTSSLSNLQDDKEEEDPEGFGDSISETEQLMSKSVSALSLDEPAEMSTVDSSSRVKAASAAQSTGTSANQSTTPASETSSSRDEKKSKEAEEEEEDDIAVDLGFRPGPLVSSYEPRPGECSVESCLSLFCREEILDGDDMFACENCNKKTSRLSRSNSVGSSGGSMNGSISSGGEGSAASTSPTEKAEAKPPTLKFRASKQMLIESLPRVLTLHMKRFSQNGYRLQKVNTHVDFPLILDIAPFCTSNVPLSVYGEGEHGIRYGLFAVVEHRGTLHGGHYVAYVKDIVDPSVEPDEENTNGDKAADGSGGESCDEDSNRSGGEDADDRSSPKASESPPHKARWWYISDTTVQEVSEAEVLKREAYILFYERYH